MIRKSSAQVIQEVTETIEAAIKKNQQTERIIITCCVAMFLVGLGLLVFGAVIQRWEILIPGGLVQFTIVWPLRKLMALSANNMRLRILPQLMRLADTQEAKYLAAQLVENLIQQAKVE